MTLTMQFLRMNECNCHKAELSSFVLVGVMPIILVLKSFIMSKMTNP